MPQHEAHSIKFRMFVVGIGRLIERKVRAEHLQIDSREGLEQVGVTAEVLHVESHADADVPAL